MIGQTLDRYRIESKIGEGGMGVVYKARDTHLDRIVAIKVLPPEKVADPDRKERFVREARAASALNHPNIVTVHDIRSDGGVDFIVMEYAGGRTLDRVIAGRGLPVIQALRYGVQIADALAKAHEAGIVHRDLKPSNLIVTGDDRVKVLDFGLAKLLDPADVVAEAKTRTVPLTDAGMVVGTAAYMSPEQAEGRPVDARSDIFSFGAVLYEMMTGRKPFTGDSNLSVLAKILNDDPAPPSTLTGSIPPDVERAILRCLRKDPARRFQTMADLKVALDDLVEDSASGGKSARTPVARASRRWWSWRWGWLVVVTVLALVVQGVLIPLGVLSWAFFMSWRGSSEPPAAPLRAVPLAAHPGAVRYPSFSPDGNHVAFSWNGPAQDNPDIYVQQIGAGAPLRLTTNAANDYAPVWSPDGRAIAFLRPLPGATGHELRLIPPLGGTERKLTEIRPRGYLRPVTLGWCPDSRCVLVTDSTDQTKPDALFVVSTDTGEKRQLTTPQYPMYADTDPAVSPDGRWLVFRRDHAPFSGQLQLVALGSGPTITGEPRSLTATQVNAYGPRWISNSEFIFSGKGSLWRLTTAAGATPERLPFVGEDGIQPAVSQHQPGRPARLIYVRNYVDTNVWRITTSSPGAAAASPPAMAVSSTRRDGQAQLSPDGQRVVFVSDRSGESEIWVADAMGANAVQLTFMGATPGFPRWSPDGRTIVFHSNPEGQGDIFIVSPDGGRPRSLTSGPDTDAFASYSRDGEWVYFSSSRGGTSSIWKVPATGGEGFRVSSGGLVTAINSLLALESADRLSLFYVDSTSMANTGPFWRLPLAGGDPVKVADAVLPTNFEVLERGIYYIEPVLGAPRLQYFDFGTRRTTTVVSALGTVGAGLSASADGRTILITRVDSSVDDLMLVDNFR